MENISKQPIIFFILTDFLVFLLLFLYRQPLDLNILVTGGIVLVLTLFTYFIITFFSWGDKYIFIIASMLVTLGIAMLYRLDYAMGFRQIGWYVLGILAFVVSVVLFRYIKFWDKLQWGYVGLSVALFLLVQIFGVRISGAKNWIAIGNYTLQPSEFIKILFILYMACYFCGKPFEGRAGRYQLMLVTFLFCGFLILQREWGSTLLFFGAYFLMLFIYRFDVIMLLINLVIMGGVGTLGAMYLHHIKIRISTWLDPWTNASSSGYQITQSLFAIAAGDFFGTGLGLGMPGLIPEVHSDFIFAAICEEMGIFGGVAVILLFFILIYRGFKISLMLEGFDKCVAVGITVMLALQTFIIIGGVIKFIPLTGITLPFISAGGSSLITTFAMLGILQAMSAKVVRSKEAVDA